MAPKSAPSDSSPFTKPRLGAVGRWILGSAVIGVLGGLAALAFRWMTEQAVHQLFRAATGLTGEGVGEVSLSVGLLVAGIPALGGLVTGLLIFHLAPEAEGHGTDSVIRAYHRLRGVVRARVIALKALTSAITIGTGGSAGQEGPVAQIGAGLGSDLATRLKLSDRDRRIFLLSGATAGVGAMFSSPLGGALFMPEVLYRKAEFEGDAIIPCIISSILAYTTFSAISGAHRAVEIDPELLQRLSFHDPRELLIYLVLGLACALAGWVYTRIFYGTEHAFTKLRAIPRWARPALGGLGVGLLALALGLVGGSHGVLFGGYELMRSAIAGELSLALLALLVVAKIIATSLSISSGGSGGVFAPALAIGALLGALVGQAAAGLFPGIVHEPGAFALVGMGGFFAGVAKVPVASVIMVSEMTGSYALLAPLLLVAVVHMVVAQRWTLYQAQVAGPVDSPAHAGDFVIDVLESIRVQDVLGKDSRTPRVIHEDVTLRAAMRIVSDSHETHFPVVDDQNKMVGIFSLTDLRRIFLEDVVEDVVIVRDFMNEHVVSVKLDTTLDQVSRLMTASTVNAVPVVDESGRQVLALLERNSVGRAYAERLEAMRSGS